MVRYSLTGYGPSLAPLTSKSQENTDRPVRQLEQLLPSILRENQTEGSIGDYPNLIAVVLNTGDY